MATPSPIMHLLVYSAVIFLLTLDEKVVAKDNLCGAECLYVAINALSTQDMPNTFSKFVKSLPPASQSGYSLAALFDIAEKKKGVYAKLLKLDQGQLVVVSKTNQVILHLQAPGHFVLVEEATANGVKVFDPDARAFTMSSRQLDERWRGNCMVLSNKAIVLPSGSIHLWLRALIAFAIVGGCLLGVAFLWSRNGKGRFRATVLLLFTILFSTFVGCPTARISSEPSLMSRPTKALVIMGSAHRDLGEARLGEILKASFIIKNESASSLHILQLKPSCSCAHAFAVPDVLAVGESGLVMLEVNTEKSNSQEASAIIVSDHGNSRVTVTWKLQGGLTCTPSKFPIVNVCVGRDGECSTKLFGLSETNELEVISLIEDKGIGIEHFASILGDVCKVSVRPGPNVCFGNYSGCAEIRYKDSDTTLLRIPWIARVSVPLKVVPKDISFRPSQSDDGHYVAQIVVEVEDEENLGTISVETIPLDLPSLLIEKSIMGSCECVLDLRISREDFERIETLSVCLSGGKHVQNVSISR